MESDFGQELGKMVNILWQLQSPLEVVCTLNIICSKQTTKVFKVFEYRCLGGHMKTLRRLKETKWGSMWVFGWKTESALSEKLVQNSVFMSLIFTVVGLCLLFYQL